MTPLLELLSSTELSSQQEGNEGGQGEGRRWRLWGNEVEQTTTREEVVEKAVERGSLGKLPLKAKKMMVISQGEARQGAVAANRGTKEKKKGRPA